MKKTTVINLIILDESGSMAAIQKPTIAGFSELIQEIKNSESQFPDQVHFISFVTFNNTGIKNRIEFMPVKKLNPERQIPYYPNSMTPLYDAIGISVLRIKKRIEKYRDTRVLVTILTDGLENASKEFAPSSIRELIDQLKAEGWTFTFIGADFDVEKVAKSINIVNYCLYSKTDEGVSGFFDKEKKARKQYMRNIRDGGDTSENYFDPE